MFWRLGAGDAIFRVESPIPDSRTPTPESRTLKMSTRTFIAVEPSDEMRQRAASLIGLLRGTPANVKWVETDNLHWTLKFLGDVQDKDIATVCAAVAAAAATVSPFAIAARGAGAFPRPASPRTVWLGVADGQDEFAHLHAAVEKALKPLGFRSEHRRFQPHMTLGRVRHGRIGVPELGKLIAGHADFDAGSMVVSAVTVFASRLDRAGPTYHVLATAPLAEKP